ncbi:ATP-dependent helicase [Cryptosporidium ubiquitum]|uniref:RNA helicase n=1 Tax=Cryptosporidium ubiquitum TaxID=857276 RepID=A0A1J4MET6_9CRYT|nr:ATP-dependent helicase [Cryptosporidium ubiquitum]OII72721.1 ATP-dependent helicase [Cryptosporidium ubiquitum]
MSRADMLPIYQHKEELLSLIRENDVSVIVGETGSGKSTLLPAFLLEGGFVQEEKKMIAVTQPRRIAAISLAEYVAKLLKTKVGNKVGYSVRFKTEVSKYTKIKYLTDGMLIRECVTIKGDRSPFESYSVIIVDEAHERSIRTDFLLGLLKMELFNGSKLKVVIMSATFQSSCFENFFASTGSHSHSLSPSKLKIGSYSVPGRQFPVQLNYLSEPELDYLEAVMITILTIHFTKPKGGDILVFLPGQEDIHHLYLNLTTISKKIETLFEQEGEITFYLGKQRFENIERIRLFIQCLYASMPSEQQSKVFDVLPENYRKIILSTNIAETSVTLPNIVYVVDSGLEKLKFFQSNNNIDALVMREISKASSIQRAGRAGRLQPGEVYRIYTKQAYSDFLNSQTPEILRTSLSETLLELIYVLDNYNISRKKEVNPEFETLTNSSNEDHILLNDQQQVSVKKILNFPFLSYPSKESILSTLKFLYRLEALNKSGNITELGIKLTMLPVPPFLGKLIYHSIEFGCTSEAITLVSMLSAECLLDYCNSSNQKDQTFGSLNENSDHVGPSKKKLRFTHNSSSKSDQSYKNYLKSIMTKFGDHVGLIETYNTWISLQKDSGKIYHGQNNISFSNNYEQINFCNSVGISHTSLLRARSIREQLISITRKIFNLKTINSCTMFSTLDSDSSSFSTDNNQEQQQEQQKEDNKWTPFYKCLTKSFWQNVAKLDPSSNKQYLTEVNRQLVNIHPTSSVSHLKDKPKWIIFTDIIQTKKTYIRIISAINHLWLNDYCSKWFITTETLSKH